MHRLIGSVRHYPWGDPEAIPRLLGREPDGNPWAELWFGTHPSAPSLVELDHRRVPLEQVAGRLPVLVKVLAAAEPLSLQLHPDATNAREGYAREETAGMDAADPHRSYPDPYSKPELLCALTPFEALCGAAPTDEVDARLGELGPAADPLRDHHRDGGLVGALAWLLHGQADPEPLLEACQRSPQPVARWVVRLAELHPDDPTALAPLLLNHVSLQPGDALFLTPGTLHAYLHGTGVEVMSASDNVVRCGLTTKHTDPDEVLRLVDPTPAIEPVLRGGPAPDGVVPAADFRVQRVELSGELTAVADHHEIWLCIDGDAGLLRRGEAGYVGPGEPFELTGPARLYRVIAPTPSRSGPRK
jgi:mannose-6-phosphate isomerase